MRLTDAYVPRILIADDQPDVLEALRFLIKGEGYQAEAVNSPAGILEAVESRDFDAVVMDLNYTRDTTSGQKVSICSNSSLRRRRLQLSHLRGNACFPSLVLRCFSGRTERW